VDRVGEQNSSKDTIGRTSTGRPVDGVLAALGRLDGQRYTQKYTYTDTYINIYSDTDTNTETTSRLPGNGDTAPAMAVLGAFGRDSATPGSALFGFYACFGFCAFFCVNNKTNNTHIQYSRDLTGGEGSTSVGRQLPSTPLRELSGVTEGVCTCCESSLAARKVVERG
jgi:hypothetical protein